MKKSVFLAIVTAFCLVGCGHREPPKDEVINAMSAVIPGQFTIKDAEVEYRPVSDIGGMEKLKMEIAPKEDLYASADIDAKVNEAAQLNESSGQEPDAIQEKAQTNGVQLPNDFFDRIRAARDKRNALVGITNIGWIKLATKAGTSSTIYGTVQAAYEFKEWRFSNPSLDQSLSVSGQPRSAFQTDINIVGSEEAATLAKQLSDAKAGLNKALEDASKEVNDLIANKEKQEKRSLADRKNILLNGAKVGTKYQGPYQVGNYTRTVQIEFTSLDPESGETKEVVSTIGDPQLRRAFRGNIVINSNVNSNDYIDVISAGPGPLRGSDAWLLSSIETRLQISFEGEALRMNFPNGTTITFQKVRH